MVDINAVILTRARKVKRATIPLNHRSLFDGSLYSIDPGNVAIKIDGKKIGTTEILLFEGIPDPIGQSDTSKALAEKIVSENLIENVTEALKKSRFNKWWIIVPLLILGIGGGLYALYMGGYFNSILGLG